MKKIKILHIIKTLNLGGAESNLYNLVCAFNPETVESHVAYSCGGPYEQKFLDKKISLFKYDKNERKVKSLASFAIIFKLARYMQKHQIDVIHTHNYNAHVWGSLAAKLAGVEILEHVHDSRYETNDFLRDRGLPETDQFNQAKYFAKLSDRIVVLTNNNREFLLNNNIVSANKVTVQLNGISLERSQSDKNKLRAEFPIGKNTKIIFTAMRLSIEKNAGMILGIASLMRETDDVAFLVAGDGPQKNLLEERVRDKGLEKKVLFIGFRSDIRELLSITDIFILPTLRELHSVSMIEAMSMNVPVLVSEGVGCNDLFIEHGVNGFLINPRYAEEWATALKNLLDDESLRHGIGAVGRKLVEEKCDIIKVAQQFEGYYRELTGPK